MARIVEFNFQLAGEECSAYMEDTGPMEWKSDQEWVADYLNAGFPPERSLTFGKQEYTAARKAQAILGGTLKVAPVPDESDVI